LTDTQALPARVDCLSVTAVKGTSIMDTESMTLLALFATFAGLVVVLVGLVLLRSIISYTRQLSRYEAGNMLGLPRPETLRICHTEICWNWVERANNIMIAVISMATAVVFIQMIILAVSSGH
jgi:hypothetical protein